MLEFRILGPLEVEGDKGVIGLGGLRQRATLAILLLSANRVVSVEQLAEDLYAGAPPVTAVTQVQRQISALRRALGSEAVIETRPPGYVLRVRTEQVDLNRFEQRAAQAAEALARGESERAASDLREALALWRGAPLADLAYETFAQATIARLEEIRLATLELRFDADLALGRHTEVVPELEALVWDHPLRERLRGQLMLALYRSGRQTEALDAYRQARAALVDGFGLEPSPALQELERAILVHDDSLAPPQTTHASHTETVRAILLLPSSLDSLPPLLSVAEPLARDERRELIVASLLRDEAVLEETAAALAAVRSSVAAPMRTAAFTTLELSRDVVRLATTHDVALVLIDAPTDVGAAPLPALLASMFSRSPADVAVLAGPAADWARGSGVFVPFGGGDDDWAALELAARMAAAVEVPLRLVGTKGDAQRGRQDASRLLADASLALQRTAGVDAIPVLAEPDESGLMGAVAGASLVVAGVSPRWRDDGVGRTRRALLRHQGAVLFVHRGPRPGVLAPPESGTRFSWTMEAGARG